MVFFYLSNSPGRLMRVIKIDLQQLNNLITCWVMYDPQIVPGVSLMLEDESGWWDVTRIYKQIVTI